MTDMIDHTADYLVGDHIALMKELTESQAREAKLREAFALVWVGTDPTPWDEKAQELFTQAQITDDTALKEAIKQAKRDALLEAAKNWDYLTGFVIRDELRRMAGEIK